jgi:hypothetical protein
MHFQLPPPPQQSAMETAKELANKAGEALTQAKDAVVATATEAANKATEAAKSAANTASETASQVCTDVCWGGGRSCTGPGGRTSKLKRGGGHAM